MEGSRLTPVPRASPRRSNARRSKPHPSRSSAPVQGRPDAAGPTPDPRRPCPAWAPPPGAMEGCPAAPPTGAEPRQVRGSLICAASTTSWRAPTSTPQYFTSSKESMNVENVDAIAGILKVTVTEFEKGWMELVGERKIKEIFNIDIYEKDPEQLLQYAIDGEAAFLVKLRYVNGKVRRLTPTGRWSQSYGPRPVGSSNIVMYYVFQFERSKTKSKDIKMFQYTFAHGDKESAICLIQGLMPKFSNFSIATAACESLALVQETAVGQEETKISRKRKAPTEADDCCEIMEEFAREKIVPLQRLKHISPYDCQRVLLCLGNKYNELIQEKERSTQMNNENIKKYQCLEKKYLDVCAENKKLNNEIIEMKGNIRVMCRPRPLNMLEIEREDKSVITVLSQRRLQFQLNTEIKDYKFDCIFHPETTQEEIFCEIEPVVKSVMDGFNVCIFAYGQSGSGKTYTMEGTVENRGINCRAFKKLFEIAQSCCKPYIFLLSILEISNERATDLLSSEPRKAKKINEVEPGRHEVEGLTTIPITSLDQMSSKLAYASKNRLVASTQVNEQSSRSHCLIKVTVRSENQDSYLWLVDLGGSERVNKSLVEGERLKETISINQSLSALRDVIHGLLSKASHIPYRNSILTRLLQFSLGGDSKVVMLVQISPSSYDISETASSLEFAKSVRGVERALASRTGNSPCAKVLKSPPLLRRKGNKDPQSAGSLLRPLTAKKSSRPPLGRPPRPPDIN